MARNEKMFTRTITSTVITASEVRVADGKIETAPLEHITVTGKISDKQARKLLEETHGKGKQFVITSLDEVLETYGCTLSQFLSVATLTTEV